MRHIDAQDKRAAKNARDTAELERALLAQRSGIIAGRKLSNLRGNCPDIAGEDCPV
jgi:hypothetical protein